MKSGPDPRWDSNYLFLQPLDTKDVFRVGPQYTSRWFRGEVMVPGGLWLWVHRKHLQPYAEKLVDVMAISGHENVKLVIENQRYTFPGGPESRPIRNRAAVITCQPIGLNEILRGLQRQVRGREMEVLRWLEFFRSGAPEEFDAAMRRLPLLSQLMR